MKLVLASKNAKKMVEMSDILSHLGVEVCGQAEAGVDVDVEVEETGTTFEENSLLKAKAVVVPELQRPFFVSECKAEEGGSKRTNHTVVSPKLDRTKT